LFILKKINKFKNKIICFLVKLVKNGAEYQERRIDEDKKIL